MNWKSRDKNHLNYGEMFLTYSKYMKIFSEQTIP
jgi:hypothetical protein